MLYEVFPTFESADEILLSVCRLTKSYGPLLSSGTLYAEFQGDSRFRVCGSNLDSTLLKYRLLCYKATEHYFPVRLSTPFLARWY